MPAPEQRLRAHARRRYLRVLTFVTLSLVVIVIIGGLWMLHYGPLRETLGIADYAPLVHNANGALAARTQSDADTYSTWDEPRGRYSVEVELTIINGGFLPILVDSVRGPLDKGSSRPALVFFFPQVIRPDVYSVDGSGVFTTTSVPVGRSFNVLVRWYESCVPVSSGGQYQTFSTPVVTYSWFGVHHTVSSPMRSFRIKNRSSC